MKEEIQYIVEEFELLSDWQEKYMHIIEMGKELPEMASSFKSEDNIVRGCQSKVWLHASYQDEKILFEADSDAIITKGLIALLIRVFSDQRPDDILHMDLTFLDTIGVSDHLSMTRSNGLRAMIKQMQLYALAFKTKEGISS
ncbi:MAG: SufE family protein [Bacteroidota bacterium]